MNELLQTWSAHADPFTAVVLSVTDWDAASPCEGWSAYDVVAHVIKTERDFLAQHQLAVEDPIEEDPAMWWRSHEAALRALLADPAIGAREFEGTFGLTTIGETLVRFYGFDLLVHRWDIARSQGRDERFSPAELAEIDQAVDSFGEHAYDPGVFLPAIEVGPDADEQARVLARTGRAA